MGNHQVEVEFIKKSGRIVPGDTAWFPPEHAATYEAVGVAKRTGKKRNEPKPKPSPKKRSNRQYKRRDMVPEPEPS